MPRGPADEYRPLLDEATAFALRSPRRPSASELLAHLREAFPDRPAADLPDPRTLARWSARARPDDASGDWSLAEANPDDAWYVIPVLGLRLAKGQEPAMSNALAGWIVRLARASHGSLPPEALNEWAMNYLSQATLNAGDTRHVDRAIAGLLHWETTLKHTVIGNDIVPLRTGSTEQQEAGPE